MRRGSFLIKTLPFLTFLHIFGALRGSLKRAALPRYQTPYENIKYFISHEWESNPQSSCLVQYHVGTPRRPLTSFYKLHFYCIIKESFSYILWLSFISYIKILHEIQKNNGYFRTLCMYNYNTLIWMS